MKSLHDKTALNSPGRLRSDLYPCRFYAGWCPSYSCLDSYGRACTKDVDCLQSRLVGQPCLVMSSNCFSLITATRNSCALSSFDPASVPATR